jgi:uroporphyrinogen decarboxylase
MTSRELVIRTLNHEATPRLPRDLWISPGMESTHADAIAEIGIRFPNDIVPAEVAPPHGKRSQGKSHKTGAFTDAWGCGWQIAAKGAEPALQQSPLAESGKVAEYHPPLELLDSARFAKVDKGCDATNRFVLAESETRPFDRLRFLRGERTLMDLARGTKETKSLLGMLHDFSCKEMEIWANTEVDGVAFRDDWGGDDSLLVAPEMWREIFKPLYRDYCNILHAKDKFAFFSAQGNIVDIFGDLVKIGVDAVRSQIQKMDVEKLVKKFRGRVTFWGELDLPALGAPDVGRIKEGALRIRRALDFGSGGVIVQCRWTPDLGLPAVAALFEQWLTPLSMKE